MVTDTCIICRRERVTLKTYKLCRRCAARWYNAGRPMKASDEGAIEWSPKYQPRGYVVAQPAILKRLVPDVPEPKQARRGHRGTVALQVEDMINAGCASLQEIGDHLGVSRARIQQIAARDVEDYRERLKFNARVIAPLRND